MSTTLTEAAAAELTEGLTLVRRRAGLLDGPAQLMRYTINAVYRVGDQVIRLARGETAQQRARRVVAGAALLGRHDVPTAQLVDTLVQPVVADDWVATVWHYVEHPPGRPAPVELAGPLARLHAVAEIPAFLPQWAPIDTARRRLSNVMALDTQEQESTRAWALREVGISLDDLVTQLTDRCDALDRSVARTTWELPLGVIHGDAHVGNLLAGRLIDFDSLAKGPPEWDLVPLTHGVIRFGEPGVPYRDFVTTYGFDLRDSASWPLLRDIRELQLVTSVIDRLSGRPEVARTLGHRLRTYLAGDREASWQRYR